MDYQRRTDRTGPGARHSAKLYRRSDRTALEILEAYGFEPRRAGTQITLVNRPFHMLAQEYPELVCGMNLCLLEELLDGLSPPD